MGILGAFTLAITSIGHNWGQSTGRDARTLELFDQLNPPTQLEALQTALTPKGHEALKQGLIPKISDVNIPATQQVRLALKALEIRSTAELGLQEARELSTKPSLPKELRPALVKFLNLMPERLYSHTPFFPNDAQIKAKTHLLVALDQLESASQGTL